MKQILAACRDDDTSIDGLFFSNVLISGSVTETANLILPLGEANYTSKFIDGASLKNRATGFTGER
ncbi:hypothetical protein [Arcticibacter eurypsychrophilus]|uniref:hypothetical protein n=1 Tax=Arcticibacter eurypsychrophilus TaxID=1434752 RepID=UPI00084D4929|nr:hypothetical protein [Arcticibacter eurypsychrophilus]